MSVSERLTVTHPRGSRLFSFRTQPLHTGMETPVAMVLVMEFQGGKISSSLVEDWSKVLLPHFVNCDMQTLIRERGGVSERCSVNTLIPGKQRL